MVLRLQEMPSPNFGQRRAVDGRVGVRHLVLHYTGMKTCGEALRRLCDRATEVSAHYVVDEDGAVFHLVAEDQRAWHAGVAFWRGVRDLNSTSVGIEIVNPGHEYGYRPFPEAQIGAVIELCREICARHHLGAEAVLGHSDIAPGRKRDPGELFPWRRLAETGLGLWPEESKVLAGAQDLGAACRRLSEIGYAVPLTPELGRDVLSPASAATDVIGAFQAHYRPAKADGVLDAETATILAAVDVAFAKARAARHPSA